MEKILAALVILIGLALMGAGVIMVDLPVIVIGMLLFMGGCAATEGVK